MIVAESSSNKSSGSSSSSKNGIKSTGASGKYRTYTRGDTAKSSPISTGGRSGNLEKSIKKNISESVSNSTAKTGASGEYRSFTRGDKAPGSPISTGGISSKNVGGDTRIIYPTTGQLSGSTVTIYEGRLSIEKNKGAALRNQLRSTGSKLPTINFSGASLGFQDRVQQYNYAQNVGSSTEDYGRSSILPAAFGRANYMDTKGNIYQVGMQSQRSNSFNVSGKTNEEIGLFVRSRYPSSAAKFSVLGSEIRRFKQKEFSGTPNLLRTQESYLRLFGANIEFFGEKIKGFGGRIPDVSSRATGASTITPYRFGNAGGALSGLGFEIQKTGEYFRTKPLEATKTTATTVVISKLSGFGFGKLAKGTYVMFGEKIAKRTLFTVGSGLAAYGFKEAVTTPPGERGIFVSQFLIGAKPFSAGYNAAVPAGSPLTIKKIYPERDPSGIKVGVDSKGGLSASGQSSVIADVETYNFGVRNTQKAQLSYTLQSIRELPNNRLLVNVESGISYQKYTGAKLQFSFGNLIKGKNPFSLNKQYKDVIAVENIGGVLKINPKSTSLDLIDTQRGLAYRAESGRRVELPEESGFSREIVYGRTAQFERNNKGLYMATKYGTTKTAFAFEKTKIRGFNLIKADVTFNARNFVEFSGNRAKYEKLPKGTLGYANSRTLNIRLNKNINSFTKYNVLKHESAHTLDFFSNKFVSSRFNKNFGRLAKEIDFLSRISIYKAGEIPSSKELLKMGYSRKDIARENFANTYGSFKTYQKTVGEKITQKTLPKLSNYFNKLEQKEIFVIQAENTGLYSKRAQFLSYGSNEYDAVKTSAGADLGLSNRLFSSLKSSTGFTPKVADTSLSFKLRTEISKGIGREGTLGVRQVQVYELNPPQQVIPTQPVQIKNNVFDPKVRVSPTGLDIFSKPNSKSIVFGSLPIIINEREQSFGSQEKFFNTNDFKQPQTFKPNTDIGYDVGLTIIPSQKMIPNSKQAQRTNQEFRTEQRIELRTEQLVDTTPSFRGFSPVKVPVVITPPVLPSFERKGTFGVSRRKSSRSRRRKYVVDPLSDALSVFTTSAAGRRARTPRGKRYTEEFINTRRQGIEFFKTTFLRSKQGKRYLRGFR